MSISSLKVESDWLVRIIYKTERPLALKYNRLFLENLSAGGSYAYKLHIMFYAVLLVKILKNRLKFPIYSWLILMILKGLRKNKRVLRILTHKAFRISYTFQKTCCLSKKSQNQKVDFLLNIFLVLLINRLLKKYTHFK